MIILSVHLPCSFNKNILDVIPKSHVGNFNVHIGIIVSSSAYKQYYIHVRAPTCIFTDSVKYLHKHSGSWIPMLSARTDTLLNTE